MKSVWLVCVILLTFSISGMCESDFIQSSGANRPVVCELFTGTWCTYCYGSAIALERISLAYSREEVIILGYHLDDDFSITFGTERKEYYGVTVEPTVWFNGYVSVIGGSSSADGESGITSVYNNYIEKITQEQTRTSGTIPFECQLRGQVSPTNPEMTLRVTSLTGYTRTVNAVFVITEDNIPLMPPAPNGQTSLSQVVRAHLGTRTIDLTTPGTVEITVSFTGTIPYVFAANLKPAVFLQDPTTREIMGSVGELSEITSCQTKWESYL